MGAKEELLESLARKDSSGGMEIIHASLISHGLKWKGPRNSQTILYYFRQNGKKIGVAAMRQNIFSFPAPFWKMKAAILRQGLEMVSSYNLISTEPAVSSSQYSAGQISINRSTIKNILDIIESVIIPEAVRSGANIA